MNVDERKDGFCRRYKSGEFHDWGPLALLQSVKKPVDEGCFSKVVD